MDIEDPYNLSPASLELSCSQLIAILSSAEFILPSFDVKLKVVLD